MSNLIEGRFYRFINTRKTDESVLRIDCLNPCSANCTYFDHHGDEVRKSSFSLYGKFASSLELVEDYELEFSDSFYIVWSKDRTGKRKKYATLKEAEKRAEELLCNSSRYKLNSEEIFIMKSVKKAYIPSLVRFEDL